MAYIFRAIVGCLCPHQSVTCVVSWLCLDFLSTLWNGRLAHGPHGSEGRLSRQGSGLAPPGGARAGHTSQLLIKNRGVARKYLILLLMCKETGEPRTKDEPQRGPTSGEGEERTRGSQTGMGERVRGDPRVSEVTRRELCPLTPSISPTWQPDVSEQLLCQKTRARRMHKFTS